MDGTGWGTLIAFGTGLFQKHLLPKLPNSIIPYTNLAIMCGVGWATTGDVQLGIEFGLRSAGQATLGHQMVKIPIKKGTGTSI